MTQFPNITDLLSADQSIGTELLVKAIDKKSVITENDLVIFNRVERAASNVEGTLLSGIEAIGDLLSRSVQYDDNPPSELTVADIGYLISHLSLELRQVSDIYDTARGRLEHIKAGGAK